MRKAAKVIGLSLLGIAATATAYVFRTPITKQAVKSIEAAKVLAKQAKQSRK